MTRTDLEHELHEIQVALRRERERSAHLEARLQAIESVQRKAWELAAWRGSRRVDGSVRGEH